MSVPYHAWTHRPKALGGTDPIESSSEIKYIVCKNIEEIQTFAADSSTEVLWQENVNPYPECFEPLDTEFGPDYNQIKITENGLYTVSVDIALSSSYDHEWQLGLWSPDRGTSGPLHFRSNGGKFYAFNGYPNANLEWTFRMDGAEEMNDYIEFHFINMHATQDCETQFEAGVYIELRKWPGDITMTGRRRDTSPG